MLSSNSSSSLDSNTSPNKQNPQNILNYGLTLFNDGDGDFDCDDEGCMGSPDCSSEDEDSSEEPVDDDNNEETDTPSPDSNDVDDDGDGYSENQGDCNDSDATIYPNAYDPQCDYIDQDCDGETSYSGTEFAITVIDGLFPCAMDVPNVSSSWSSCAWDSFGGAADGFVKLETPNDGSLYTSTYSDWNEPTWNEQFVITVRNSQEVGVYLYDEDPDGIEFGYGFTFTKSDLQEMSGCGYSEYGSDNWGGWFIGLSVTGVQ